MKNLIKELRENKIHISLQGEDVKLKFNGTKPAPDLIARIRENKSTIIAYLKRETRRPSIQKNIPLVPSSNDGYPLSYAQNRLWVLSQFEEGLRAYNITHQFELDENYDIELLKKSVYAVVKRHEILRTVFRKNTTGEIRQFVLPFEASGFEIECKDFRKEKDPLKSCFDFLKKDTYKTFDLEKGPLLSAVLVHVKEGQYIFHYNMHHIIGDGWSMNILLKDTLAFYQSFKSQEIDKVPNLAIQYKDFAVWQAKRIENNEFEKYKKYWIDQLEGNLPLLDLPTNLNRPALKTNKGKILETALSKSLSSKLNQFTKDNDGTLFITLLALWNILLYKYTGQSDIIIGSPVAGREHFDLENQIGFYVNTVALRNKIDPEQSFQQYYQALKEKTFSDLSHQLYPFDLLISQLNLSRDTSRSAIFDMMLALQNTGKKSTVELSDTWSGKVYDKGESMTKFDVEINFTEVGSSLMLNVNYNTDVYEKQLIEQLMTHFSQVVENCLESTRSKIKDIEFLTKAEQEKQVERYDNSKVLFPQTKTIIDLFKEKVQQFPDHIAVKYKNKTLSYQALDEQSNQIAHFLQAEYDIKPDDLIGMLLDRSEMMIIAMLGILKSGAAYVPIDKNYPQERIDYMLEDSKCKLCLDDLLIEKILNGKEEYSKEKITNSIKASNLAYVIYTSGTTGQPKGTLLEHGNVVRLLYNEATKFNFREDDVWCLFHSYCFDFSVWEIFGAILYGGQLVIVPKETTRDMALFSQLLASEKVTVLNQTPSAFKMLQALVLNAEVQLDLRYLIFGGEALNISILKEWKNKFPNCRIINMYGITETTVHVTYKEIEEEDIQSSKSNIGMPLPTLGLLILDKHGKIVPEGVIGELCVYGKGLARNYLGKPEITKQRFVEFEHIKHGSSRIYKSGDFVKSLPNGELTYLGRIDNQVKIRGHRIELEEIEKVILKIKSIQQCVVSAIKNNGENALIAYLVGAPDETLEKAAVKEYLQKNLPDYMVPGFYTLLEQIPLTTNGKVNKKLLPGISDDALIKTTYVSPQNEMEETIIDIIKQTLGEHISEVGVTDNFFDLGLDSLSLIKILNQINSVLDIGLKPLDLFQFPNVRSLMDNVLNTETEELQETVNIAEDIDSIVDMF